MTIKHKPDPKVVRDVANRFSYHRPQGDQAQRYEDIRTMGKGLADILTEHCPASRELSLALTKLQEAVMWANASIACNET